MRCNIGHLIIVEILDDLGHELVRADAAFEIVHLFVNRKRGLPGHVRVLGIGGYPVLTMAAGACIAGQLFAVL